MIDLIFGLRLVVGALVIIYIAIRDNERRLP